MLRAANRIEHGMPDKNGKNTVVVVEAGQPVKGLPADIVKSLRASGAIFDDSRDGDGDDDVKTVTDGAEARA